MGFIMSTNISLFLIALLMGLGCAQDEQDKEAVTDSPIVVDPDFNEDGVLSIMVIGTTGSISGAEPFSPDLMAEELQLILSADELINIDVQVVAEEEERGNARD